VRGVIAAGILLAISTAAPAAAPLDIWLDVPFVAQQKNGCGPASVAMVMEYWQKQQRAPSSGDAAEVLRTLAPGRDGVRAADMLRFFAQHGYRAFAYAGDWADLEHQLAKGRPLIAALQPAGGRSLHYVVVAGIDDAEQALLLNDPAQRKLLKEARKEFEREWRVTGNWTLLAVPQANPMAASPADSPSGAH
jgi:ABC-type bacteriocin/lantibiotic exporter with double-glycine peptidase domain